MINLACGVLLIPLSFGLAFSAARALAFVAAGGGAVFPFFGGLTLMTAAWLVALLWEEPRGPVYWSACAARWFYVLGHELTHAVASWLSGGKVYAIKVSHEGGHADLSKSSAFIALAPYCVPFYALAVMGGFRIYAWLSPSRGDASLFLVLFGAALAFHALMTMQTLTQSRQPDLHAAGGVVFSVSWIVLCNAFLLLCFLKFLFPHSVALQARLREGAHMAAMCWKFFWHLGANAAAKISARYS